jgi:alpha/beta superfamily hydrolase
VPRASEHILIEGPAGHIQVIVDVPEAAPRGIALVAHPHPLLGGTNSNKVVYTLAHALRDLGYVALRPNFRGVGKSAGVHDHGEGERDDLLAVLDDARRRWPSCADKPLVLAGFSFGAFVQTRVAKRLQESGTAIAKVILVALAAGPIDGTHGYVPERIPAGSVLIHGDRDTTVPMANVLAYAEPLGLSVTVLPGVDHFFHGRLQAIRDIVGAALCPASAGPP